MTDNDSTPNAPGNEGTAPETTPEPEPTPTPETETAPPPEPASASTSTTGTTVASGLPPRVWRTLAAVQFALILVVGAAVVVMGLMDSGLFANHQHQDDQAARYICPMHPDVVKDHPADCPICGMALVKDTAPPAAAADVWICPMHPQIRQHRPGDCPICGMALVKEEPAPARGPTDHAPGGAPPGLAPVTIPETFVQRGGIRTARVEVTRLADEVLTVGRVEADETRLARVHSRVMGWIAALHVNQAGQRVEAGQPLLDLFSREILQTQQELVALSGRGGRLRPAAIGDPMGALADAARQRLLVFGVPNDVIDEVVRSGRPRVAVPIRAPVSGWVIEKMVVDGAFVEPQMRLFEIADLSVVWVWADVYERDIAGMAVGNAAEVTTPATGDRRFDGRVTFLDPVVDEMTRALRVRIEIPNPDMALRPGMWASVRILGAAVDAPSVPYDAVVDTGRGAHVFVQTGPAEFAPRSVVVGRTSGGRVEIRSGLEPGEIVVASGTFLVDSESRLRGSGAAGAHEGHGAGATGEPTTTTAPTSTSTSTTASEGHGEGHGR